MTMQNLIALRDTVWEYNIGVPKIGGGAMVPPC